MVESTSNRSVTGNNVKDCNRCKGTGITVREAFTGPTGTHWPRTEKPCPFCDGRGTFAPPDYAAIVKAVKGRKGLRSRRPDEARAYYVWRMARFHGGADVTLPMMATFEVTGDPYVKHLDVLAELVAQRVFGTDAAGAIRWAHAMGHEVSDAYMRGQILPASARPGGPVADSLKPMSEALELI
jgi:hypothetical protein